MKSTARSVLLTCSSSFLFTSVLAQPNTAYGIEIGAPLQLPECGAEKVAASLIYSSEITEPCVQGAAPGESEFSDGAFLIAFPRGELPAHAAYGRLGLHLVNGRVAALSVRTHGARAQQFVFDDLVAKYGRPTAFRTEPLQNAMGARFNSIEATWDRGPRLQVAFSGILDDVTEGEILIGTRAGLKERAARINRAAQSARKPL